MPAGTDPWEATATGLLEALRLPGLEHAGRKILLKACLQVVSATSRSDGARYMREGLTLAAKEDHLSAADIERIGREIERKIGR